jgi:TM2 domain-containing membrane protein YozV
MLLGRTHDPSVIEHRLLDLAYTTDSVITAPLLAYYAPCSIEDAERVLDRLVAGNRLRLDVDEDGNLQYVVPNRERLPARAALSSTSPASEGRSTPTFALTRQVPDYMETRQAPNAAAAAILSMIVPGAGQLYAGRPLSAVAWFALVSMGYLLLIVPGVLLHVLCVAAAGSSAHRWRPSMA